MRNAYNVEVYSGKLEKAHNTDAGYDMFAEQDYVINPRSSALISTGVRIHFPENLVAFVKSRSGLSVKHKLEVGAGVIDSGYTGEIMVHLYNHGNNVYQVNKGDKIAQLVFLALGDIQLTKVDKVTETSRGSNGFGSTGVSNEHTKEN